MKRVLRFALSVCLAGAILGRAPQAHAEEPEPLHRYDDDRRPPGAVRTKLFLAGAAITGGFYAPVLGASYAWDRHLGAEQMRIPVAGPWLGFSKTKLCNARPELNRCNNFLVVTGAVLLVFDGIGQAGGVGLMLEGLFLPTGPSRVLRTRSPDDDEGETASGSRTYSPLSYTSGNFRVDAVPTFGESDVGLSLMGHF